MAHIQIFLKYEKMQNSEQHCHHCSYAYVCRNFALDIQRQTDTDFVTVTITIPFTCTYRVAGAANHGKPNLSSGHTVKATDDTSFLVTSRVAGCCHNNCQRWLWGPLQLHLCQLAITGCKQHFQQVRLKPQHQVLTFWVTKSDIVLQQLSLQWTQYLEASKKGRKGSCVMSLRVL